MVHVSGRTVKARVCGTRDPLSHNLRVTHGLGSALQVTGDTPHHPHPLAGSPKADGTGRKVSDLPVTSGFGVLFL